MVTLGSSEVILKGAKFPGSHQSSTTRPKRSVRSVESGSGRLTYLAETKRGSHPSSVHSGHIVDRVVVVSEVKGTVLPGVPSGCT
jgi:hypothetical protein